jgi:hypothetical protein
MAKQNSSRSATAPSTGDDVVSLEFGAATPVFVSFDVSLDNLSLDDI